MKRAGNELLQFLGGLAMLIVGLYIFSQKVMVYSSFFGGRMMLGGLRMGNGLIMIPFIIGIVWMFASGGSFMSKVFTGAGVLIIIVSVILTTNISLVYISLYEWVLILVLIFGGAGLLAKILLANPNRAVDTDDTSFRKRRYNSRDIDKEIDNIKKGK